jgi:quercetin dioxygenase-like cupin family protein
MIVLQEDEMAKRKLAVPLNEALRGIGHEGRVDVRVLINEDTVGAKAFSLLVNTVKAADSCAVVGSQGHKHETEHGLYCLSGKGRYVISGEEYELRPDVAVFVPAGEYHYIINDSPTEELRYIIFYVPGGEEKEFLNHKGAH